MEEKPNTPADANEAVDLGGRLRGVFRGFVHYVQARHQLLSLEAAEATDWLGWKATRWIAGGALIIFGYLLGLAGAVAWLEELSGQPWWGICLVLAPAHFALGLFVLWSARRWPASILFEASRKEFEKDKVWLSKQSEDL